MTIIQRGQAMIYEGVWREKTRPSDIKAIQFRNNIKTKKQVKKVKTRSIKRIYHVNKVYTADQVLK